MIWQPLQVIELNSGVGVKRLRTCQFSLSHGSTSGTTLLVRFVPLYIELKQVSIASLPQCRNDWSHMWQCSVFKKVTRTRIWRALTACALRGICTSPLHYSSTVSYRMYYVKHTGIQFGNRGPEVGPAAVAFRSQ